jgi:cytosine/adenosine deaminase-related metal-dependent hydrolase
MAMLIRGGTVINHDHSRRADVLIEAGKIVAVAEKIAAPTGCEIIEAGGCDILPGGIDPHTHMELLFMGTVSADDFGHQGGGRRRHHHDRRLLHPGPGRIHAEGLSGLAAQE